MRRRRLTERDPQRYDRSEALMVLTGMKEWRQQHPTATLREIEVAMDERLAALRAGMLEELARMSPQADWSQATPENRPTCEHCGVPVESRGKHSRWLQTSGGQPIELTRSYGICPQCGQGLFPLDEELGLSSSALTPHAQEGLARLAAWVPYAPAALLGVQVSKASARRFTLQAGEAGLQEWKEQTTALQKALPPAPVEASHQV